MDKKLTNAKISYGMTNEIFAQPKGNGKTIIVGGVSPEASRWARVLTRRAAHQLWHHLTSVLFPEKSVRVTGMAQTAPLTTTKLPSVTSHLELLRNGDAQTFYILGWIGNESWWFSVDQANARTLWAALDVALYPAGWQGSQTQHKSTAGKLN